MKEKINEVMEHLRAKFPEVTYELEELTNYYKVIHRCGNGQRSVYCFIAKKDNQTKALGIVKCGDILKAASWSAPTKHARGNVFEFSNTWTCFERYGITYLK